VFSDEVSFRYKSGINIDLNLAGIAGHLRQVNMDLQYNESQRKEYLNMTDRIGVEWLEVFRGDTEFYQAAYWDLFTRLWKSGAPERKTDALKFMVGIKSAQTAGKYIETAIKKKLIIEKDNPEDARSRLLELSPQMKERLDLFFDQAVDNLRKSNRIIDTIPTSSIEV
jgi:hypothetical protein